jgi:hypothetical protein
MEEPIPERSRVSLSHRIVAMQFIVIHGIELRILVHVGQAVLLGAAIGLEREVEDKPAGLLPTCSSRALRPYSWYWAASW